MLAPVLATADVEVDWGALAAALVCVVAGHAVGRRAFARIDAQRYEPLLLAIVVAAGAASIVAGVDHCLHLIEQPTGSVSAGVGLRARQHGVERARAATRRSATGPGSRRRARRGRRSGPSASITKQSGVVLAS